MDITLLIKAVLLGIVEGLTEFLPISSTGHLILVGDLLNFNDDKGKVFEIVIQFAAILAVCWEYRAKILSVASGLPHDPRARRLVGNVLIAFIPAAVLGALFAQSIKAHLFAPVPVAMAFIVGGLVILWAEKREHVITVHTADDLRWQDALKVGLAQTLALVPGTSRSGATIIGGLLFGLSRKAATEFSFFLAIPTLSAATVYEVIKYRHLFSRDDWWLFAAGGMASFISAFLCVRWLLRYISNHDFTVFAWYRIGFGMIVLATSFSGMVNWSTT